MMSWTNWTNWKIWICWKNKSPQTNPIQDSNLIVKVVAAVFQSDNKYLACRRKAGLSNGGLWEFPGGKQNPDESPAQALLREIKEELTVTPVIGESLGTSIHHYENKTIELHCMFVSQWQGDFVPVDHDMLEWFSLDALSQLPLSEADVPFIERIKSRLN